MEAKIVKFIKEHHVLTLATQADGQPYCANAFYAYDKEQNVFVFTSDLETRHGGEMMESNRVAASIVLETKIVGRIQGLQLTGVVSQGDESARSIYLKSFPYAALTPLSLWVIEPDFMKYTDNTLGFGKKIVWNK